MMKIHLGFLLAFAAIVLAACAAFFSIYGLSQLFAGAAISVIIMATTLEISKLIIATYLHSYWDNISKVMKIYLTSGVVILACITSAGIYGYLSNAYQITANNLELHEGKVGVIQDKINYFQKTVDSNSKLIDSKSKRMDQLVDMRSKQESRIDNIETNTSSNRRMIASTSKEIETLNKEIDDLNQKNATLNDSIGVYTQNKLSTNANNSVSGEIGPLKYMAEITGMEMNEIVNIFILLLVFVFDPLAICLVIATNSVFKIKENEKNKNQVEEVTEIEVPVTEIEEIETPLEIEEVNETLQKVEETKTEKTPIVEVKKQHVPIKYEDIREVKKNQLENNNITRNFSKSVPKNNYIERK